MDYLVIAATALEIGPFLDILRQEQNSTARVDVLITGVGLTSATYSLGRQLATKRPDYIIQAGIAGSFDPGLPPGSVAVVEKELIADQGVLEAGSWKTTMDMGFTDANALPYTDGWLLNPDLSLNVNRLPVVNAVTVNQVSTNAALISAWKRKFRPALESMEGAALHFVAISEKIPFLQLRAVSNLAGERDKKNWDIKNAVLNLNKELLFLLPQLKAR
ncbi:MAG: futalosine hydrolase [Chitinophagaceae bacterium]|nr:MAG: futalosine hydrolase [Chitinophagaceae bacterium]